MPRIDLIKLRRDTATDWTSANPVLAEGEKGLETDTLKEKVGDGVTAWNDLDYWNEAVSNTDTLQDVTTRGATVTDTPVDINRNSNGNLLNLKRSGLNIGEVQSTSQGTYYTTRHPSNGNESTLLPNAILNNGNVLNIPKQNADFSVQASDYNAATNTPALANTDTGQKGVWRKVSVAGTQDFGAGSITFAVGDIIANDGSIWYKKAELNTIDSYITGEPTGSDQVLNVVSLTQAEYDAGTPVTTTLYIITDA